MPGTSYRLNTATDKPELLPPGSAHWVPCAGTPRYVWLDTLSELATAGGKPWRIPRHQQAEIITGAAARNPEEGEGSDVYEATLRWLRETARGLRIRNLPEAVDGMQNTKVSVMQRYESAHRLPPDVRGDILRALRKVCGDKRSVRLDEGPRKCWVVPGERLRIGNVAA